MKRLLSFSAVLLVLFGWMGLQMLQEPAWTNSSGSPGGYTGSDGDNGNTCATAGCHDDASPVMGSGIASISTDVPSNGYIPGQTYTITAEIVKSGHSKFGFELTSEKASNGNKVGTLTSTSTETQTTNNGDAITHESSGTNSSGGKTWQMDWEAPPAGTGKVILHAAFNVANGNGNNSGDTIHVAMDTLSEDSSSTAIPSAQLMKQSELTVHPVPASERISISGLSKELKGSKVRLRDLQGRVVQDLGELDRSKEEVSFGLDPDLDAGTYLLEIQGRNAQKLERILIE